MSPMDPLPQPERRFLGDTGSISSFKINGSASAPASLKANSLKVKNQNLFIIPAMGRRRRARSSELGGGIQDMDFNAPFSMFNKPTETRPRVSYEESENNACTQNKTEASERKAKRSKTIMRLISTRFRSRPPTTTPIPSSTIPRSPQITSAFGSKETREAALRERGLLPPKPNLDLSLAELERDRQLPIMAPPCEEVFATGSKVSAASIVQREWEMKHLNAKDDLERMKSFTFGGLASSTPLPPSITVDQADSVSPTQSDGAHPSPCSGNPGTPRASISSKHSLPPLSLQSDNLITSREPSLMSSPHLIPLPPSPLLSATFLRSEEDLSSIELAASFPLPPSPGLSVPAGHPIVSLSPPTAFSSAPSHHTHTGSGSSRLTAVSYASRAMSVSTLDTSESSPAQESNTVPVIVESPVDEEESLFKDSISARSRELAIVDPNITEKITDVSFADSASQPRRIRNFTDPTSCGSKAPRVERRKSFNPFKRSQLPSQEPSADPSPGSPSPLRRLSVGATLKNMRRTVTGTLSRPKAPGLSIKADRGFDASHLPPSPTVPAAFTGRIESTSPILSPKWSSPFLQQQQQRPITPEVKLRIPVSPTLYSPGNIVAETNNIEDEESRRMTELAFLG